MQVYAVDAALVAVDVIRATTTAITAVSMGRQCHLAPTVQAALETASRIPKVLLAGELGGDMPNGFDLTNSPAQLAGRPDISRPLVLLSSTGTRIWRNITMPSSLSEQVHAASFARKTRCAVPGLPKA
jgi:2-phosphosulfolactate phosphatase